MLKWLKQKFHKTNPLHVCKFECVGWCSHFNQVSEIDKGIKNPSWYHYPNLNVLRNWLRQGFDYARVMQSHWQCSCGKQQTFFFLSKPSLGYGGKIAQPDTIPQTEFNEMITYNPLMLGSNRASSFSEVTNELIERFC